MSRRAFAAAATFATLAALALAACLPPPPPRATSRAPAPGPHGALVRDVQDFGRRVTESAASLGLSVAVIYQDELIVQEDFGYVDPGQQTKVGRDTPLRVGVLSEQFTAAAIVRLAREGKLHLDDEVATLLPAYPMHGKKITVRHLLTHTSGLRDFGPGWQKDRPVEVTHDAEPGERWAYSGADYLLLGLVIEKVSGTSYGRYLNESIIAPARLEHTRYCGENEPAPPAYRRVDAGLAPADVGAPPYAFAAGGVCSTAVDLLKWSRALRAGQVVGKDGWTLMSTPVTLADGSHHPFGFGVGMPVIGGHKALNDGSALYGFVSALLDFPDDDLQVAVIANTEGRLPVFIAQQIAASVLHLQPPERDDQPVTAEAAAPLVGTYETTTHHLVTVSHEDGRFLVRVDGKSPLQLFRQPDGSFRPIELDGVFRFELVAGKAVAVTMEAGGIPERAARVR
jgi:CubicO group peptidase (beta-lactamase class C family)